MSDLQIRAGVRAARQGGPGALLNALGIEGVALLRSLCNDALALPGAAKHGHDPMADPQPGDVLALCDHSSRDAYSQPTYRVVLTRDGERLSYTSNPWDERSRPRGRKSSLRAWRAWCNDGRVQVLRRSFEPEVCERMAAKLLGWREDHYEGFVTCTQAAEVVGLLVAAFRAAAVGQLADPENGQYGNHYQWAVGCEAQRLTRCVACRRNEAAGVPAGLGDPGEETNVGRDRVQRVRERWERIDTGALVIPVDVAADQLMESMATLLRERHEKTC